MSTPPQDDFAASTATVGRVAVGGAARGEITPTTDPNARDHDWFAVELEDGKWPATGTRSMSLLPVPTATRRFWRHLECQANWWRGSG